MTGTLGGSTGRSGGNGGNSGAGSGATSGKRPVGSVGSYIPGGRYPMFGSAQMSIIPAKVAGVRQVTACTPPMAGGGHFPATIHAIAAAGADRIFVLGGVPALALMAFGMGVVAPVDILCGAGNKFVAEAKRQLFGRCGIDLLAGPTEIMVLADDQADPALVACDLLGQAEHDPMAGSILITDSEELADAVEAALVRSADATRHLARAKEALTGRQSAVILTGGIDQSVLVANAYGAEHLEIHTEDAAAVAERITSAGAIFIGEFSPVPLGDYLAGSNHVLPTGGTARFASGLGVTAFLKAVSLIEYDEAALAEVADKVIALANAEDLPAHGEAISARLDRERL